MRRSNPASRTPASTPTHDAIPGRGETGRYALFVVLALPRHLGHACSSPPFRPKCRERRRRGHVGSWPVTRKGALQRLAELPPWARADLLRVLTSESRVRADVIRQFHERGLDLADVLIDLEADDLLRLKVID